MADPSLRGSLPFFISLGVFCTLQTRRLLLPVTVEFLRHLQLAAKYERESGELRPENLQAIAGKVDSILEASKGMPESSRREIGDLARTVRGLCDI